MTDNQNKEFVTIANGVGNKPIKVEYYANDTVGKVLERANLTLERGATVSIGRKRVNDINQTTVASGDTLVIAGKVCNG